MKAKYVTLIISICSMAIASCQNSKKDALPNQGVSEIIETKSTPMREELLDFDLLIGDCNCKSIIRDQTGKWRDTISLRWKWKYIMEKNGVYDEGWYQLDGKKHHFSSLRVYDSINQHWYVSYFTPKLTAKPETWIGGKKDDKIVLKKEQKTPQGAMESVLTFFDISAQGFSWEGKIISEEKKVDYSFWKIWCVKDEE